MEQAIIDSSKKILRPNRREVRYVILEVGCAHISFDKKLLPQINIHCGEVMQNNEMSSLMA